MGLQAGKNSQQNETQDSLLTTLEQINYPFDEITNNLGYQLFLK